jgi:hypothetical protein
MHLNRSVLLNRVKEKRKNEVANLKVDNRDFSVENAIKLFLLTMLVWQNKLECLSATDIFRILHQSRLMLYPQTLN